MDLGLVEFGRLYSQLQQTDLFDRFETGRISGAAFVQELKASTGLRATDEQVIAAWNAMLLDLPLRRLQILQQLQLHFDTFLLSNTNEIHEAAFNKILKAQAGFQSMAVFFDKVYYSHRVGLRKPGQEIFRLILEQHGLDAAKTLFIDDSPQHIATAKELGLQTIFMEPGMTIEEDIFKPKH